MYINTICIIRINYRSIIKPLPHILNSVRSSINTICINIYHIYVYIINTMYINTICIIRINYRSIIKSLPHILNSAPS